MSADKNTVVHTSFIEKEFDPFKEQTISRLKKGVSTKIDKQKDHDGDKIDVKLAHWKSETFEFIRLDFVYHSLDRDLNIRSAKTTFTDIKFNCDLENIESVDFRSNQTKRIGDPSRSYVAIASVDLSLEDCRKIARGKNLEIRIYRPSGAVDLDDAFEGKICEALASLITNGVDYDWQAEVDRQEKLALEIEARKPKSFLGKAFHKLFSLCIWAFTWFLVISVGGAILLAIIYLIEKILGVKIMA